MCRTSGRGWFRAPGTGGTVNRAPLPHGARPEANGACGAGSPCTQSRGSARGGEAARRRRPREPPSPAQPSPAEPSRAESSRAGSTRETRGHGVPDCTWLQVMNSLVWVSSTSVHSLLRKAGTLELCFIVSWAQGFRILLPNAEVAAAAAAAVAAAAAPGNAHHAGAAGPGLRPLGAAGRAVKAGRPRGGM